MLQHTRIRNNLCYRLLLACALLALIFISNAQGQTTQFTYQGRLTDAGNPGDVVYDFQFKLFDSTDFVTGVQQGPNINLPSVRVENGVFTVQLDFGAGVFDGSARFLEISLRPAGSPDAFTLLSPRQPLTSTPYALRSVTAGAADTATNAMQLGGLTAGGFIQNTTSQQAATNFNIGGTGSANILEAATQFNLGGLRILGGGANNLFVGLGAGFSNTTGTSNSFFGRNAGQSNTEGFGNSFFGSNAGPNNTTGDLNAFFGSQAGSQNSAGSSNSFFGAIAGLSNSTGNANSFFGSRSGTSNTTGASNSFFGTFAGDSNTTGGSNSFFGSSAGRNNTTGFDNSFIGMNAGEANSTGSNNTFFGRGAGLSTTAGSNNTFVGPGAGRTSITGSNNTVIGFGADINNFDARFAAAIGSQAQVNASDTIVIGKVAGTYDGVMRPADTVVIRGNLGVGTSTPGAKLHVNGAGEGIRIQGPASGNANGAYLSFADLGGTQIGYVGDGSSTDMNLYLTSYVGDVILYTPAGGALTATSTGRVIIPAGQGGGFFPALEVAPSQLGGSVIANNLYIRQFNELSAPAHVCWRASNAGVAALVLTNCTSSLSSERDKTDMQPFGSGLDVIRGLKPISFRWKKDGQRDLGLNAEDVAEVEPLLVTRNDEGKVEDVKESGLQVAFINAIKELEAQIKRQQREIEELKLRQQEVDALKALVCADRPDASVCKSN